MRDETGVCGERLQTKCKEQAYDTIGSHKVGVIGFWVGDSNRAAQPTT
jgi:hypothetical protein